jgi:hypothetical protein
MPWPRRPQQCRPFRGRGDVAHGTSPITRAGMPSSSQCGVMAARRTSRRPRRSTAGRG